MKIYKGRRKWVGTVYNRPDIQLNPGPAGYPASVSGSVSENVEMHIIRHKFTQILKKLCLTAFTCYVSNY